MFDREAVGEPGRRPRVLTDGALRLGSLICYEDILPDFVASMARTRPNLLVTLANHAWFGTGAAPDLALALSVLRSVESRRDLVRAANTGVSSFVDALGRVTARSSLVDPGAGSSPPPELLLEDVRLVEAFALGPWSMPVFPFACGLALALAVVFRRAAVRCRTSRCGK